MIPRLQSRAPRLRTPKIRQDIERKSISRGPGKHWAHKPAVIIRRDKKEVCNLSTPQGCAEYHWRILLMWVRQDGLCCDCMEPLKLSEATFEHQDGRGAGRRDDRIAIFDDEGRFIKHLNGAAHLVCNSRRGSKRTDLYHGNNASFQIAEKMAGDVMKIVREGRI